MTGLLPLEALLDDLSIARQRVARYLEPRYQPAVRAFPKHPQTTEEFEYAVANFHRDVQLSPDTPDMTPETRSLGYHEALALLAKSYGGPAVAFRIYCRELEGGKRAFLNDYYKACYDDYLSEWVTRKVERFFEEIQNVSGTDRYALACYYQHEFRELFPDDVCVALNFRGFLLRHEEFYHALKSGVKAGVVAAVR